MTSIEERVAGCVREAEAQARRLGRVEQNASSARVAADRALAQVEPLAQVVEDISAALADLASQESPAARPAYVSYLLIDPENAADEMSDLVEWLGSVFVHYPNGEEALGECWPWHPWAVEELRVLRAAWLAAHAGSAQQVADWHDRLRPNTARRLSVALGMCRLEKHAAGREADQLAPTVPAADAAIELARWWSETYGRSGAPKPTPDQLAEAEGRMRL